MHPNLRHLPHPPPTQPNPNLRSKPITTQMNDMLLDLSQSVSQVQMPMHASPENRGQGTCIVTLTCAATLTRVATLRL